MQTTCPWWGGRFRLPTASFHSFSERRRGMDAFRLQHSGHFLERGFVDLRNAALVDAEHVTDLLHSHVVGVVEEDHFLVALREGADGMRQGVLELAAFAYAVRLVIRGSSEFLRALAVMIGVWGGRNQADGTHFHLHAAPAL